MVLGETGSVLAGTPMGSVMLFLKGALDGSAEEAVGHVTPEMERAMHNEFSTRFVADAYALLGYRDDALRWLRTTIDRGFINYPCLAAHDVFLENLRDDPEFQQLMVELKPRWEAVVEWERNLA